MIANFRSDNETPVATPVMQAIIDANEGTAFAYGDDDWSLRLDESFSALFEAPVRVLPVPTGTVANAIALACVTPPWGAVLCHDNAHIYCDESGAPEFYGHGLRLVTAGGANGKLEPETFSTALRGATGHGVHSYEASALSLTQCTESGTLYSPEEISALCTLAREAGLATHLDGARFGNAVAALGCAPADLTWRAGIDMLSFGASKNGCLAAEALVFFERQDLYGHAERLRKRGGHLYSKMRYLSAQLLAYIDNGLWLELAQHANKQAAHFAEAVTAHGSAELEYPTQANEVFVRWRPEAFETLEAAGMGFLGWPGRDDLSRFVFGHTTTNANTDALIAALEAIE
ncbi:MAG: beta-eliminating lyase-related protein [Pseudomonadota bacterium]